MTAAASKSASSRGIGTGGTDTRRIQHFDKDQNSIWHSNENVSHELGAAAVMYDDRVILFKEQAVDLASNFSGIGTSSSRRTGSTLR